jgi:hypothetical protein
MKTTDIVNLALVAALFALPALLVVKLAALLAG